MTLDYTFAQQELAEDRGEQTIWMQRNGSFDHIVFDDVAGVAYACPVARAHRRPQGLRLRAAAQRAEEPAEVAWLQPRLEDHRFLQHRPRPARLEGDQRSERSGHRWRSDGVQLRGHELPDDEPAVVRTTRPTGNPNATCTGFWTQQFQFNNGLPIMSRTLFASQAAAIANTGGNSDVVFNASQLGSQVLRIGYQAQETEVKQARLDGKLEFENGRFQFGFDTRKVEMNQRTSGGYLEMGTWSRERRLAGDRHGRPGARRTTSAVCSVTSTRAARRRRRSAATRRSSVCGR